MDEPCYIDSQYHCIPYVREELNKSDLNFYQNDKKFQNLSIAKSLDALRWNSREGIKGITTYFLVVKKIAFRAKLFIEGIQKNHA